MPSRLLATTAVLAIAGCGRPGGPASTHATSGQFATAAERVAFLHRYVTFRRTYESLDFDLTYHNNGDGGPSDWDVRLVAVVPAAEVSAWVPPGKMPTTGPVDRAWLSAVPTGQDLSGLTEWYTAAGRQVGIDRGRRLVAYRAASTP